jgi:hypothetical protein
MYRPILAPSIISPREIPALRGGFRRRREICAFLEVSALSPVSKTYRHHCAEVEKGFEHSCSDTGCHILKEGRLDYAVS